MSFSSIGMWNSACLNSSLKSSKLPALVKRGHIVLAILAFLGICISEAQARDVMLIESGSFWKYLEAIVDQGTSWRAHSFNDSNYASGPAEFGYGDGDEITVFSYGYSPANRRITTYFRY